MYINPNARLYDNAYIAKLHVNVLAAHIHSDDVLQVCRLYRTLNRIGGVGVFLILLHGVQLFALGYAYVSGILIAYGYVQNDASPFDDCCVPLYELGAKLCRACVSLRDAVLDICGCTHYSIYVARQFSLFDDNTMRVFTQ